MKHYVFDFTPVDMCSDAIMKLAFNFSYNNIYHVLNPNMLSSEDIVELFKKLNQDISFIDNNEFSTRFKDIMLSNPNKFSWIISDINSSFEKQITIDCTKTVNILKSLGFSWHILNTNYYINLLKTLGEEKYEK